MLSLPYAMAISGPGVALFLLLFFAIIAFYAAQVIVLAGRSCQKSSYVSIVHFYFGAACARIVDSLISVALLVAAISYVVGLADLLPVRLSVFHHYSSAFLM